MLEIRFVTSSAGKVASLSHRLDAKRYTVIQETMSVPEIQADTALEVATYKARFAYEKLGKPLIVQDSAFHINALSGFPGPYIKYINETIGVEGLLALMQHIEDRSVYFEQALVYIDLNGDAHPFTSTAEVGTLAQEAYRGESHEHFWSDLWRIYIPQSSTKTLAELFVQGQHRSARASEITQFADWLAKQSHA